MVDPFWAVGTALMTFSAFPPAAFCCFLSPGAAGFPLPFREALLPFCPFSSGAFWAFRAGLGGGCAESSLPVSSGCGSCGCSAGSDSPASLSKSEVSLLTLSAFMLSPAGIVLLTQYFRSAIACKGRSKDSANSLHLPPVSLPQHTEIGHR